MGNALIGRMLMAALKLDVTILTETETTSLVMSGTSVTGVRLRQKGIERQIDVAGGVILASGGFAQHKRLRPEKLPHPLPEFSPSAPGSTGALHDLAFAAGAFHGETASQPCFWAPVSRRRRKDGSMAVFPHFVFDRSQSPASFPSGVTAAGSSMKARAITALFRPCTPSTTEG